MKNVTTAALLASLFISINAFAQFPTVYTDRLNTVLDSICNKYNLVGASAAVSVPGYGVWEGVHGISHVGTPISPDMIFGLGSNTKTYVAALMLKLQEQGMLDLDDTLGTWIQTPNVSGQITVRQLLNNSSGLYSYTNNPDWGYDVGSNLSAIWEPEDLLPYILTPTFAPGTGWEYSNTNFLIAGLIAKEITGQNLITMLKNQYLTAQGLTNTHMIIEEPTTAMVPHVWSDALNASGYWLEDMVAEYGYSHNAIMSTAWAAGALMSTAKDNALFWDKLIHGNIVNNDSWNEMTEFITLSGTLGYGLGIMRVNNFNGHQVFSHGGTNIGFINENIADPASGVTISVLTNQDSISNSILLTKVVHALHKVTLQQPTGIAEAFVPRFSIYPNPVADVLFINSHQPVSNARLIVYDVTGRAVVESALVGNAIDVSELPNGCYLVKLQWPDATIAIQKIFVER
ncbi:MAG TPA: serine hydrolase [Chitinophagales bacterium]|nr:serine hydrolase [Chitinophagales bacterium]